MRITVPRLPRSYRHLDDARSLLPSHTPCTAKGTYKSSYAQVKPREIHNQPGSSGIRSGPPSEARSEASLTEIHNQPGSSGIRTGPPLQARSEASLTEIHNQPGSSGIRSGPPSEARSEASLTEIHNQPGSSGIRTGPPSQARSEASLTEIHNQPGSSGIRTGPPSQARSEASLTVQENSSGNPLFNEIHRWMEHSTSGVPPPETFKVPKLPARMRRNLQQTANERNEHEADQSSLTFTIPIIENVASRESATQLDCSQSVRSASPISTITSLDFGCENYMESEENRELQCETPSDDIELSLLLARQRNLRRVDKPKLMDAPVFHPTPFEFEDPIAYFEKIMPITSKYGLCKVVPPPNFSPTCNINDAIRFVALNQYIARVFRRWGPATRKICALRSYLDSHTHNLYSQPPLIGGMEVNLVKLYFAVQRLGGLRAISRTMWCKIAEAIGCGKITNPDKRLHQLYVKYLVPYETLAKGGDQTGVVTRATLNFNSMTTEECSDRQHRIEQLWLKKQKKMIEVAVNPLHCQKRLLGESDSSDDDDEETINPDVKKILKEADECITRGRQMNMHTFKRVANNTFKRHLPRGGTLTEIEQTYWGFAILCTDHVCVNSASIDTGSEGYGFTSNEEELFGRHPWNLKVLSKNNKNVLRLLGPVVGLTVPTLHLGMLFTTRCWHRDPHGLPWIEYMHQGTPKIWYGIPEKEDERFRKAVQSLSPSLYQHKSIWLPSDISMIPSNFLLEYSVSHCKLVQNPGEFVIVLPKSYSSSICTGFTISESVYFATNSWLDSINLVFQEMRESSVPSRFSLEQMLITAARDPSTSLTALQLMHAKLAQIISEEVDNRAVISRYGLEPTLRTRENNTSGSWTAKKEDECDICRTALYISRVKGVFRRNGSLCLPHVIQVLKKRNENKIIRDISEFEFEIFFTVEELNEIILTSKRRLLNIGPVI